MEEPILKLARVAGPVLKFELADTMPPTWRAAHHHSEWWLKDKTDDTNTANPAETRALNALWLMQVFISVRVIMPHWIDDGLLSTLVLVSNIL